MGKDVTPKFISDTSYDVGVCGVAAFAKRHQLILRSATQCSGIAHDLRFVGGVARTSSIDRRDQLTQNG